MSVTTATARDEASTLFFDHWRAHAHEVWEQGVPEIVWQGVSTDGDVARSDVPWARFSMLHNEAPQRTFGTTARFERMGVIIVQVFSPTSFEEGLEIAEGLAVVARNAYEGRTTPSGVWFRNSRLQEAGVTKPWWQVNMSTEFTYEERK